MKYFIHLCFVDVWLFDFVTQIKNGTKSEQKSDKSETDFIVKRRLFQVETSFGTGKWCRSAFFRGKREKL